MTTPTEKPGTVFDENGDCIFERLEFELEQIGVAQDAALRAAGWKYTCDTPGCFWLWEREINGRVVAVSKSTAIAFQYELWAKAEPGAGEEP